MGFYLDSALLEEAKELKDYPFVRGITTNPSLMAKELGKRAGKKEYFYYLQELAVFAKDEIYVQTTSLKKEEIVREGKELAELLGGKLVVKVPCVLEGLQAVEELADAKIPAAVTAVFTPCQAYLAGMSGARYIAPYCHRLDKINQDGLQVMGDILAVIRGAKLDLKVLVASIKTLSEITALLKLGVDHLTVPLSLMEEMLVHPLTSQAVSVFSQDFQVNDFL